MSVKHKSRRLDAKLWLPLLQQVTLQSHRDASSTCGPAPIRRVAATGSACFMSPLPSVTTQHVLQIISACTTCSETCSQWTTRKIGFFSPLFLSFMTPVGVTGEGAEALSCWTKAGCRIRAQSGLWGFATLLKGTSAAPWGSLAPPPTTRIACFFFPHWEPSTSQPSPLWKSGIAAHFDRFYWQHQLLT